MVFSKDADELEKYSELGKKTPYDSTYNPERLFPILRAGKREEIGIDPNRLPFIGWDCWNHYEVSWLNGRGKPVVAIAEIIYDCASPFLIESKSLKLYFNSLNQMSFNTALEVEQRIREDIASRIGAQVTVVLSPLAALKNQEIQAGFPGTCLDALDIDCSLYEVAPHLLRSGGSLVEEVLYSHLLKSNCLVTHQPDWGSVQIAYVGPQIEKESLLQYLVSFRNHNEFHEQCIERIFVDILEHCRPSQLTIYGRYTRRGGLDINPYRSTSKACFDFANVRLIRQ